VAEIRKVERAINFINAGIEQENDAFVQTWPSHSDGSNKRVLIVDVEGGGQFPRLLN
jgi:hypothetical protein